MMRRAVVLAALAVALAAASTARGQSLLDVRYDAKADQIVVDIAYRGTNAEHRFEVEWDPCSDEQPAQVAGRIVDLQGGDAAEEDFEVTARLGLDGLACRPAIVTLRLGRVAHATLFIPEAPATGAAGGR